MGVFSGEATCRASTTANTDLSNARFTTNSAVADPQQGSAAVASANQTFEVTTGTAITLYWAWHCTDSETSVTVIVAVFAENNPSNANTSGPTGTAVQQWTVVSGGSGSYFSGNVSFTPPSPGTYRLYVWCTNTDTINGTVHMDSDGYYAKSGTVDTYDASIAEASQGYLRAGIAVSSASVSNVSAGGALDTPLAYGDDLYGQMTVPTALLADDQSLNVTYDVESTAGAVDASAASAAGSTTTWSSPAIGPLNQNAPNPAVVRLGLAADSPVSGYPAWHYTAAPSGFTLGANSGPSGVTSSTNGVSILSGDLTFSSTLNVTHLLQLNNNTFGTPPMSNNVTPQARLSTDIGFISAEITNARGVGQNGLSLSHTLQDAKKLVSAITWGPDTTATEGGQAGWDPTLEAWTSSLPGGAWNHTVTCSTAGATTLTGATATFTLLAADPYLRVILGGGVASPALAGTHWEPGFEFLVGVALFDRRTDELLVADAAPMVVLGRFNLQSGLAEYLGSDYAWHGLDAAGPAYEWTTVQASQVFPGGDTNAWLLVFTESQTSAWYPYDIFLQAKVLYNGTPYIGTAEVDPAGQRNSHIGAAFALGIGPLSPRS